MWAEPTLISLVQAPTGHYVPGAFRRRVLCRRHQVSLGWSLMQTALHSADITIMKKGCGEMSIYHCSIKIISRAGGRSAVASAAYRSGEKLYNDETGLIHDFTSKGGVIMNEIMLPENAPKRYLDREILWNEVQKVEKRSDAQFAREVEVALPCEMSREQQIVCIRSYVKENFVEKGMIADWALHDKGDGNPHAHIMLTMRGIDEHEQWLQKQKTVFANARDYHGRPIFNPDLPQYNPKDKEATAMYRIPVLDANGNQKTRVRKGKGTEYLWEKLTIPANDWNEHYQAEIWRESWAKHCNEYLDKENQIDHRSYARQGVDMEPTIHEGVVARQIEKEGKVADRCQVNREIKERNSLREQMKAIAKEITEIVVEKARTIYGRFKEFRRSISDSAGTRADDEHFRESAERTGGKGTDNSNLRGRKGRINELKRNAELTEQEIATTEREITATDQRIAELKIVVQRKESELDERFKKLKSRRGTSGYAGGDAGPDREIAGGIISSTAGEIRDLLAELAANERNSEEKRENSSSERANRETQRERFDSEKERGTKEAERESNSRDEESEIQRRSNGRRR